MITLIAVSNPFQPAISRTVHEVEWHEGMTLADVMEAAGVPTLHHACVIDGLVVPEKILAGYLIDDGITVICMPAVGGGSWGKMAGMLAVLAVATIVSGGLATGPLAGLGAGMLGSAFASVGLGGLTAGMATMVGSAIALGGNMLISAFMGGGGGGGSTSNSFNPTGPKTVSSGGIPIPKGYGTYLSGGNIIASYVTAEGLDDYVNVLLSHGWGPAAVITDLTINHNTIGSYAGVTYMTRLGTNTQTKIPNFNNIVNGYPQEIRAVALAGTINTGANPGTPIVIQGTGTQTQGLSVVMQFPNGVFYSNNDGSLRSLSVAYQVQYSISGANNWQNPIIPDPAQTHDLITYAYDGTITWHPGWVVIPTDGNYSDNLVYDHDDNLSLTAHTPGDPWTATQTVTYYNADGTSYQGPITLTGEWQVCDATLNQQIVYGWMAGYVIFTDCNQGTLYHTTNIFNLPPNKYDVRVTKYGCAFAGDPIIAREANNSRTGDQTWVYSISEIEYQDLAYPNMILCGVRAMSTGQVSGANINVGATVTYGITAPLPAALAGFGLDNPAIVAYDMLVAPFYGGNIPASQIDVPSFVTWAQYNDELVSDGFTGTIKRHVFNGIFESTGTNLWKSLQKVAMMSQASIVQIGRNYSVVVDMPVAVPAQVFTSANVLKDSIKDTWLSFDDRANRIEVTFADAARNYRTDEPCAVMLPADIQAGVEVKTTRVQLLGCTNRAQAWHWAYRKLLATDLLLLARSFDVGIEAVACQVGSVIGVQDDVAQWCFGGRIQAGSTATALIVDVPDLTYVVGAGWTVSVVHPSVTVGTGVISSVVGNLITFSSTTVSNAAVQSFENGTGSGVAVVQAVGMVSGLLSTATVVNAAGFTAGQAVTFYMQDVVDTQPVSAYAGNVLTPYAPFIQTPSPDSPWVYGQSAGAFPAKLFTVTNIRKSGDLKVTLDCLEYNPAVYADDTPIITETLGIPDLEAAVTSLTAIETHTVSDSATGGMASNISVGWKNGPATAQVEIWVATNEANQPLSAETLVQTVSKGTTCTLIYPTGAFVKIRAVGVDGNGRTAPYSTAPIVTITVVGSQIISPTQQSTTVNLVPDSNLQFGMGLGTYWSDPGAAWGVDQVISSANLDPSSPTPGCMAFVVGDAASGISQYAQSENFMLAVGQTYTLSGFIDAYYATAQPPSWTLVTYVYGEFGVVSTTYGVDQNPGATGRVSGTFTISQPGVAAGTLISVAVIFDTNGCTIASGGIVVGSAPMLQSGSTMTAYVASVAATNSWGGLAHRAMSPGVQSAVGSTGTVGNLGGVSASSITPIATLMPQEAGANVTETRTSLQTGNLNNHTLDNLGDGATRFGAAEAGANVTANHTAADTAKVNGVASIYISPIGALMPSQAGADVTAAPSPVSTSMLVTNQLTGGSLSQYVPGNYVNFPGTVECSVYCVGGIVDVLLGASNGSSGPYGYIVRMDARSGYPAGTLLGVTNGTWGRNLGTTYGTNSAALSGWHQLRLSFGAGGVFNIWVDGVLTSSGTDTTYALGAGTQTFYGYEIAGNSYIAPPSGNANNLGGVPAASITPISTLMPAEAGADATAGKSLDVLVDGTTYQRVASVVGNKTTTASYASNSVSSSVLESTVGYQNFTTSATVATISSMAINGGWVLLQVCGAIASTNANASGWGLTFYRNGVALAPGFAYQAFAVPGDYKYKPFSFSIVDAAPGAGPNTYTVTVNVNTTGTASLIPVNFIAVNFKA